MSEITKGKYGCEWEGGAGVGPDGRQCGECHPGYEERCELLENEYMEKVIDEIYNDLSTAGWNVFQGPAAKRDVARHLAFLGYRKD